MSTFKITQDQQTQYDITGSHNTWIMKAGVVIESPENGIFEAATLNHNTYIIKGDTSGSGLVKAGLRLEGGHSTVEVSEGGKVFGDVAVIMTGNRAEITNFGYIQGSADGFRFRGENSHLINHSFIQGINGTAVDVGKVDTFTLDNGGEITGDIAILADAAHLTINLGKHSDVSGDTTGIKTQTAFGETAHITNQGTLAANGNLFALAIEGGMGREVVRNSGVIEGSVSLGDSRDRFDGRGGSVTGVITGGLGDDIYKISNKNDYVYEATGEGFDKLSATFSYTLPENSEIEAIRLIGKGDFKLHGSDSGNFVIGNVGNNKLFGEGGEDGLTGGAGTDFLNGGDGTDIFIFLPRSDKEIVMDFVDGVDRIGVRLGNDITSINDLLKHHLDQQGDDLVISGDGTDMIIRDFDKSHLTADDFAV